MRNYPSHPSHFRSHWIGRKARNPLEFRPATGANQASHPVALEVRTTPSHSDPAESRRTPEVLSCDACDRRRTRFAPKFAPRGSQLTDAAMSGALVALAERIELWTIDRLRPYERNPRTHSEAQVDQIAASMVEFGWTNPVLVDDEGGILAGHGRLLAARKLGLTEVPVIWFEHLSEAQKRAYVLADNQIALQAGWDDALLAEELAWLRDERFDLDLIGFDASELERLLALADGDAASDEAENEVPEPPRTRSAARATSGSWATIACCAATRQCWRTSSGCSAGSWRT